MKCAALSAPSFYKEGWTPCERKGTLYAWKGKLYCSGHIGMAKEGRVRTK